MADQLDVRIQIHLHETTAEIKGSLSRTGKRPFARLLDLGLVNSSLLAVHAIYLTESEIARCAEAGVAVAHCPRSNLKLASGVAPIAKYRDAGITLALGTDGAASNNVLDILAEMRLATLLAKVAAQDAAVISPAEALHMGTLGGARALGLEQTIGSIEIGKSADLACFDLEYANSQPIYDVTSQLVYTAHATQATDAWIAGRHLLEDGQLINFNIDGLLARSNEWRLRFIST